jgi:hypothetical protein
MYAEQEHPLPDSQFSIPGTVTSGQTPTPVILPWITLVITPPGSTIPFNGNTMSEYPPPLAMLNFV